MAASASVPGAGENRRGGPRAGLAEARAETATLREVLRAIAAALTVVTTRLDALEAQANAEAARDGDAPAAPTLVTRPIAPSHGPPRAPAWTLRARSSPPGAAGAAGLVGAHVTGETLRLRREALGISQAAVARAAYCSRGLVAEVERGRRRSAQTLADLANVLDRFEH